LPEVLGPERVRACQVHLLEKRNLVGGSLIRSPRRSAF
jgi:hypothetical protein